MPVLLCRPREKLTTSLAFMQDAQLPVVAVGLIEISPNTAAVQSICQHLAQLTPAAQQQSVAIVVSTHAADILCQSMQDWPAQMPVYAVGPSTAHALQHLGCHVQVPDIANSEGLLSLPGLQSMHGKTVYLFKGEGGRVLIPSELTQRGARIREVDLYQRHRCVPPIIPQPFEPSDIRCLVATSGEIMQAAWDFYDHQWLKSLTWIVVSRRLVDFAAKLGISKVIQSDGATDPQLKQAINQFLER